MSTLSKMSEAFSKEFQKEGSKMEGISMSNSAPEFFITTGNYVLNKIVSGNYLRGFAQGRWGCITGPSGAGKSFVVGNVIKAAQDEGYGILVIDSENALDEDYLSALGVDVHADNFFYRGVKTIVQASEQFSTFTKLYRKHGMTDRMLVVIDSLDMLMTDSELKNYDKGDQKGDQGQQAKQLKKLLQTFVQDIKNLPFVGVCTKQAYKEQDPIAALSMPYVVTESVKFAFSQMIMVMKLMLKSEDKSRYEGITMQAMGYKTRFTKPFQKVKIEVPYDSGMDPFTGLLEAAESVGVVTRNGSWYLYGDQKFQKGNFDKFQQQILQDLIDKDTDSTILDVVIDSKEIDHTEDRVTRKSKIQKAMDEATPDSED